MCVQDGVQGQRNQSVSKPTITTATIFYKSLQVQNYEHAQSISSHYLLHMCKVDIHADNRLVQLLHEIVDLAVDVG